MLDCEIAGVIDDERLPEQERERERLRLSECVLVKEAVAVGVLACDAETETEKCVGVCVADPIWVDESDIAGV